ncbi:short-chain dehydrogenase/reductase-like protein [Clathrospora elynae]|uniref:Short-chain dehydrogenase/reductase-like protein n=1 Tax=Clathrospora elynae TaxID=706981 RepID=A0A6A5SIX7_9PLEO|nr:short-chain dehydrogenase/reductase-like protein [Clathrospora elynae]
MPGRLSNKIAVITGSSSGIGRATALAFASEGASLVCSDLREEARTEYATDSSQRTTVQEATSLGAKAIFVRCDTTSSSEVEALVSKAVEEFGRVDIMVNNAGISIEAGEHGNRPVWEYDESAFDKTLDVNIKGVFLGIKFASKQMMSQEPGPSGDRGWIVNLASVYGLGGGPGLSGYVASKHAVLGLTKVAAWDCAPHHIHVNALCPGYTATSFIHPIFAPKAAETKKQIEAQHPFKGLGTPQDIARAAVFLASEDAAWVTGIGLPVDGGYSSM